ncbi:MAG: CPBP family intramembrane metalloprotease [Oscillospiraceae bacterium]|jgi:membrane protease YdiL (CAAX protease family)|nr:CPBP family intramembrane metalloprotease [Oscillospiraceae bacterium]
MLIFDANQSAPLLPVPPPVRADLRRLSRAGGCALLLICILQQLLGLAIGLAPRLIPGYHQLMRAVGPVYFNGLLYLATSVLAVMPGALLGLRMLTPAEQNRALPFSGRRGTETKAQRLPIIFAGAALCLLSNTVTAVLSSFVKQFGLEFTGPDSATATTLPGVLFSLLTIAVVPALVEELFMRGVLLQPLRRYGDGFAVVCSALLFALLHQNMVQAPMAFFSGLVLGWAAVRTGSLWAPIGIHMWNNAASVILSALEEKAGEGSYVFLVYLLALGALGLVSLFVLLLQRQPRPRPVPPPRRARHYLLGSAAMVIALIYFLAMLGYSIRR